MAGAAAALAGAGRTGLGTDLVRLVDAFRQQADREVKSAQQKGLELYADRTGISYLLPPQRSLNHFYEDVVTRLLRREELREGDDETSLLLKLIDGDTWQQVHARSHRNPDGAVGMVKARLEGRVTRLFAERGAQVEERRLLPSMSTLLAAAAGDAEARAEVSKEALDLFSRKLTGLLPVGFTPEGTGPLRALVTHPRVHAADEVQEFLAKALRLPSDAKNSVEYRGVESDSITVVLFRSEMSLTQVPEARKVLRQWARAKDDEQAHDVLRWRQRLGFEDDWMVSSAEDRRTILHRLLCCLWNGQVDVLDGQTDSPVRVRLRLFPEKGAGVPGVRLRLGDFPGGISSWSELLRSYERWTVLDDERTVEDYCRKLMGAQPLGLARLKQHPGPALRRAGRTHRPAPAEAAGEAPEGGRPPGGRLDQAAVGVLGADPPRRTGHGVRRQAGDPAHAAHPAGARPGRHSGAAPRPHRSGTAASRGGRGGLGHLGPARRRPPPRRHRARPPPGIAHGSVR